MSRVLALVAPGTLAEALRPALSLVGPVVVALTLMHAELLPVAFLLFVLLITLLDGVLPDAHGVEGEHGEAADTLAELLPHLHLPLHIALLAGACHVWTVLPLSLVDRVGLVLGFGVYACAFGINVAHELIHRRSAVSRNWGGVTLALVCYGTFAIEHVRGHHRLVATAQDPSSAPAGRSFWAHLPRAIAGNVHAGFGLEAERLRRRKLPVLSRHNQALRWTVLSVVVAVAIGLAWGPMGLLFFALQSLVAIGSLELTNYVEHYGLRRARRADGRLEPVTHAHSWSSPVRFSNALFFNVQRHAHHHARPSVPYHQLRHLEGSPTHPAGYPAMMALALVPPLWHQVMDPRLAA